MNLVYKDDDISPYIVSIENKQILLKSNDDKEYWNIKQDKKVCKSIEKKQKRVLVSK